jgi:flavin reductase (DIM6/NTAB) family NADH-FMN oxidoreductase RutF
MEGVSNHFAKMATLSPPPAFVEKAAAPVLEDAHAWYATKVEQLMPAGDHILVLCKVMDLAASPEKNPLIYYQGYKKITSF